MNYRNRRWRNRTRKRSGVSNRNRLETKPILVRTGNSTNRCPIGHFSLQWVQLQSSLYCVADPLDSDGNQGVPESEAAPVETVLKFI
ncbi:DNA directed RNA polymerase i, second largest subunit [Corchorus capsularis]|uniref:DNA directed RNA polymerase i, second largest subunit n=1 Tax=Corchorus capsularis TaxID=210143 RepID=A0A1R3JWH6_COCAP|nr:DNA directed RNA polymerase i, second largest subunit [Corchorus capsularis]